MKRIMVLGVLLALAGRTLADRLTATAADCAPGGTTTLDVAMENTETNYTALQMDVVLPEGFSLEGIEKSTRFGDANQEVTVQVMNDGSRRILCYSMANKAITGTSGTLLKLRVKAGSSVGYGSYAGQLKNIKVATTSAKSTPLANVGYTINLPKPKTFTLTYLVNDEVYRTYDVEFGTNIIPEDEPTKEGYTFSGWSTIPTTMPAEDVTVTGTFTVNYYKLTYMVDGEVYKSFEVEYGVGVVAESVPTKEGYTFSGWSEIPSSMPSHDVTVTGLFTKGSYTLTYVVNGETYKTVSYDYGENITPESEPTKEGYTFSGWSSIPSTMPSEDVTVTGTFTVNYYKLTYMLDGEVYKTSEVEYGTRVPPEDEPTKEGYTFQAGVRYLVRCLRTM